MLVHMCPKTSFHKKNSTCTVHKKQKPFFFQLSDVQLIAVSHWGIHLVKRESNQLQVIKSLALAEVGTCSAPRPTSVMFDGIQGRITLHTPRAQQLSEMVNKFCAENRKVSEREKEIWCVCVPITEWITFA